jgi:hypothetical protein
MSTLEARVDRIEDRLQAVPVDEDRQAAEYVDRIEAAALVDPQVKALTDELNALIRQCRRRGDDIFEDPQIEAVWRQILALVP